MKQILFCLFLLLSFSSVSAANYNYIVDCITDSSGNIVKSTDAIVPNVTYKIVQKKFSNIDENSNTTLCVGKFVSKALTIRAFDITSTIKTESITSEYVKSASLDNLQQGPCKTSGEHEHVGKNFNIPSDVTVSRIAIQYYAARDYGSGGNAKLYASKDGKSWDKIAEGFNYHSGGAGQLWTDINTSYRYLKIYHRGDAGIRTVISYITIYGAQTSGTKISDASFTVNNGQKVTGILIKSSNSDWDTSGIDIKTWNISVKGDTLSLSAKNSNITSDQVITALKSIQWNGTTNPDPKVTIYTLG